MAASTLVMFSVDTRPAVFPLVTRETVAAETPARAATMAAVTRVAAERPDWGPVWGIVGGCME